MRQVVRALIKNTEGKYLLVQHHKSDTWTLPGGHIEPGESIHQALKREIKEEFHMTIKILWEKSKFWLEAIKELPLPIATYRIHYESKKFWKVKKQEYIFHARVKDDSHFKIQEKEIKKYEWFSLEEIKNTANIFPQIPMMLQKITA